VFCGYKISGGTAFSEVKKGFIEKVSNMSFSSRRKTWKYSNIKYASLRETELMVA
jgi:hypothetical protein